MQLAGNHALSIKAGGAGSHLAIQQYGRDSSASSTPGKRNRLYSPPELSTKVTARTSGVKGTRERLTPTATAIRPISLTLERRLSPWCGPTTHRVAFSDNASRCFPLSQPTTHRGGWWRN